MLTSPEAMTSENAGPSRQHVFLGIALGLCGLFAIAGALAFVDPLVRDTDGVVFSLSTPLGPAIDQAGR